MKKRFSEEQIIGFLREADAGIPVKDLCRRHGFSEASYYLWRSKFGGMSVSEAKRLKELEAENAREIEDSAERENVEASYYKSVQNTGEAAAERLLSKGPKNDACKFALTIVDTGSMGIEEYAKAAKLPIVDHRLELVEWAKNR